MMNSHKNGELSALGMSAGPPWAVAPPGDALGDGLHDVGGEVLENFPEAERAVL